MTRVTSLRPQPERIEYRGHVIELLHRADTNDYIFKVDFTRAYTGKAARRETALKDAKRAVDAMAAA